MNKEELALAIAQKTGVKKSEAMKFVDGFVSAVEDSILSGQRVTLSGFGTFELSQHKERRVINPSTHQPMTIPAQSSARFRASDHLKALVRQS